MAGVGPMPPEPSCALPPDMDRRLLLQSGIFGLVAVSAPGPAQSLAASGFTHPVASGEPKHRSVKLWTRYVPPPGLGNRLDYQVSPTSDFNRIVTEGTVAAEPERDFCVQPVAEGLDPGAWSFYRFVDSSGIAQQQARCWQGASSPGPALSGSELGAPRRLCKRRAASLNSPLPDRRG